MSEMIPVIGGTTEVASFEYMGRYIRLMPKQEPLYNSVADFDKSPTPELIQYEEFREQVFARRGFRQTVYIYSEMSDEEALVIARKRGII